MEAVRHTAVGYKFNAFQSGLLSHDNRIYAGPLQKKQASLRDLYPVALSMTDTLFFAVKV